MKVGNAGSPFKFKYSFFALMVAFSTNTPLLSGCLLGDFQAKTEEEETQLEEVDIFPPKLNTW